MNLFTGQREDSTKLNSNICKPVNAYVNII